MYNTLRTINKLPWNENLGVWLRTSGLLRQQINRDWIVAEYLFDWDAKDSAWNNDWVATNITWPDSNKLYKWKDASGNWRNSYIEANLPQLWSNFSFVIGLKWDNNPASDWDRIIDAYSWNLSNIWFQWSHYYYPENRQKFYVMTTWGHEIAVQIQGTLSAWVPYFMVFTVEGINLKAYLNWEFNNIETFWDIPLRSSNKIKIFSSNYNRANFDWDISLLRICDVALSPERVKEMYLEWLQLLH